ncbi:hypothetical protein Sjap_011907 [Stephania japonica]|uniref:Uncharacterized protein n=1 Tax=Stephania japonica TaxID=461633 RepID=A0AAP0JD85_9MAGN
MTVTMTAGKRRRDGEEEGTGWRCCSECRGDVVANAEEEGTGSMEVGEVLFWEPNLHSHFLSIRQGAMINDPSNPGNGALLSSSRVTLLCNMAVPENAKDAGVTLKKYAKL